MKKMLSVALTALTVVGLTGQRASAWNWPFGGCCQPCMMKVYCKQYNAFSPFCCDQAQFNHHPWQGCGPQPFCGNPYGGGHGGYGAYGPMVPMGGPMMGGEAYLGGHVIQGGEAIAEPVAPNAPKPTEVTKPATQGQTSFYAPGLVPNPLYQQTGGYVPMYYPPQTGYYPPQTGYWGQGYPTGR